MMAQPQSSGANTSASADPLSPPYVPLAADHAGNSPWQLPVISAPVNVTASVSEDALAAMSPAEVQIHVGCLYAEIAQLHEQGLKSLLSVEEQRMSVVTQSTRADALASKLADAEVQAASAKLLHEEIQEKSKVNYNTLINADRQLRDRSQAVVVHERDEAIGTAIGLRETLAKVQKSLTESEASVIVYRKGCVAKQLELDQAGIQTVMSKQAELAVEKLLKESRQDTEASNQKLSAERARCSEAGKELAVAMSKVASSELEGRTCAELRQQIVTDGQEIADEMKGLRREHDQEMARIYTLHAHVARESAELAEAQATSAEEQITALNGKRADLEDELRRMEDSLSNETVAKMRCQESLAARSDAADAAAQAGGREYAALRHEVCLLLRDRTDMSEGELTKFIQSHPRLKQNSRGMFDGTESEGGGLYSREATIAAKRGQTPAGAYTPVKTRFELTVPAETAGEENRPPSRNDGQSHRREGGKRATVLAIRQDDGLYTSDDDAVCDAFDISRTARWVEDPLLPLPPFRETWAGMAESAHWRKKLAADCNNDAAALEPARLPEHLLYVDLYLVEPYWAELRAMDQKVLDTYLPQMAPVYVQALCNRAQQTSNPASTTPRSHRHGDGHRHYGTAAPDVPCYRYGRSGPPPSSRKARKSSMRETHDQSSSGSGGDHTTSENETDDELDDRVSQSGSLMSDKSTPSQSSHTDLPSLPATAVVTSRCKDKVWVEKVLRCREDGSLSGDDRLKRLCYQIEALNKRLKAIYRNKGTSGREAVRLATEIGRELMIPTDLCGDRSDEVSMAWTSFRSQLATKLSLALEMGADWTRILQSLLSRFRQSIVKDSKRTGHSRLAKFCEIALSEDKALLKEPLLHADTFLFKADTSFEGLREASISSKWERLVSRPPTIDVMTLAADIVEAFITKTDNPLVTEQTVWMQQQSVTEIIEKFEFCLQHDEGNAARGKYLAHTLMEAWYKMEALVKCQQADERERDIRTFAELILVPAEKMFNRGGVTVPEKKDNFFKKRLEGVPQRRVAAAVENHWEEDATESDGQRAGRNGARETRRRVAAAAQSVPPATREVAPAFNPRSEHAPPPSYNRPLDAGRPSVGPKGRGGGGPREYGGRGAGALRSYGRNCEPPSGNKGEPNKHTWTPPLWLKGCVDQFRLKEAVAADGGKTDVYLAAARICPSDKHMNVLYLGKAVRNKDGSWPIDSCKYCRFRPVGTPEQMKGSRFYMYGTGDGAHDPLKCQCCKRFCCEGGEPFNVDKNTKREDEAAYCATCVFYFPDRRE